MASASISHPPISLLGLVSDRRTAALIAADGTVGWWCLPNFDGEPALSSFLDAEVGGHCRLGPSERELGRQAYIDGTLGLVTTWCLGDDRLELTDVMLWPGDERDAGRADTRVLVRRLRASGELRRCRFDLRHAGKRERGTEIGPGDASSVGPLRVWTTIASNPGEDGTFELADGEEIWVVLAFGEPEERWSVDRARCGLDDALAYWQRYADGLSGDHLTEEVRRAALFVHALTFAPTGAVVASISASLPERIGGSRNYDYRYSWVRDGSLAMSLMARCGRDVEALRYLDWLAGRGSDGPMPLQVVYRVDGSAATQPVTRQQLSGYRGSRPVQFGNPADTLYEIDTFGYLADCILIHLEEGCTFEDRHWDLLVRLANFTAENWRKPGASIWEITPAHHFVVSKVLSWVTLDRATQVAERTGRTAPVAWGLERTAVHAEICDLGFSRETGSFRQRYGADAIDAGLLLIPLMRFLPDDDPRVLATVDRIERELTIDGHVHRFVPREIPNQGDLPVGEEEGSFLLCTCWLAQVRARQGRLEHAERLLAGVAAAAGGTGLLSEGVDARSGELLGNLPLTFTHVEYARAVRALAEGRALKTTTA